MNKILQILLVVGLILLTTISFSAFAGPGGKIASAMFQTFWGKIALVFLIVIFLPLITYTVLREYFAQRRTLTDLRRLAVVNKLFDWLLLRERITDCFYRIHVAWHNEDMSQASEWMTDWYWKNQQLVYIDQWAQDGLVNKCQVKKITAIKPLFLAYRSNDEDKEPEGSRLVVSIVAEMEDYLAKRDTGEVVEGKKGFKEVETVWTFAIRDGQWVVANIEEDTLSLTYAQLANELPNFLDHHEITQSKTF